MASPGHLPGCGWDLGPVLSQQASAVSVGDPVCGSGLRVGHLQCLPRVHYVFPNLSEETRLQVALVCSASSRAVGTVCFDEQSVQ